MVITFETGWSHDRETVAVVSTIALAAERIIADCRARRLKPVDVDGFDIPGLVRTDIDEPDAVAGDYWLCWHQVDEGPREVTVDDLRELRLALGL